MQGKKSFQEKLFISFQLSDHVPADNLYRRLNEMIDLSFLYESTASYYGTSGQKSIDPVVFMKLILAGYLENLNSDRRIINALRLRLDLRYFIGYDLDEELPWHSTLSRTRQLYGAHVFTELFKKVLKQCIDQGMISGRRQAIDSVFIKANASIDSMLEKDILNDADDYGRELMANEEPEPVISIEPDNPAKDQEQDKRPVANNTTHYSPVDPDARLSTKPGKPYVLNYLGQVCVDTASHLITHVQAFLADRRDSQCLSPVLVHLVSNLKEHDIAVQEVIADTNYSSGTALRALEAMGITGYIPNTGRFQYERDGFTYHPESDHYECKNGKALTYQGTYGNDKRYTISRKECIACPYKKDCIGKKKQAAINETTDKPYYDRMHVRMQTKKGKQLMKKRQSTVEPVIGTLVNYLGIKRVNSRGIDQANKCFTMAAIAYNLKKLLKYNPRRIDEKINNIKIAIDKKIHCVMTDLNKNLLLYVVE
jgi:transposase